MNDFFGGPHSGASNGPAGGGPGGLPPVLLGALGAALLISVIFVALIVSGGGDSPQPLAAGDAEAVSPSSDARVQLTVSMRGAGSGSVRLTPGITCSRSCQHTFPNGTRLRVTAHPDGGSTFEEWGAACAGFFSCSILMNRDRSVSVRFELAPADSSSASSSVRADDCHDGRDNDGDGLVDAAQDPSCAHGTSEGTGPPTAAATTTPDGSVPPQVAPPPPPPPPPAAPANECADGKDNDNDGLIDTAQDPGCVGDHSEAG